MVRVAGLTLVPFRSGRASVVSGRYFFFFNDTATTEIYTLSLHDALPIYANFDFGTDGNPIHKAAENFRERSEEHTSELQSRLHLVCRLLLEKKPHDMQATNRCSAAGRTEASAGRCSPL